MLGHYDKREEANKVAKSPLFSGKVKRPKPNRLGNLSYGQRNQGGIGGGGGTAAADQSGTGVGKSFKDVYDPETGTVSETPRNLFNTIGRAFGKTFTEGQERIRNPQSFRTPSPADAPIPQAPLANEDLDTQEARVSPSLGNQSTDFIAPATQQEKARIFAEERGGTSVGDSGFIKRTNAAGATRYEDQEGNFITDSDLTNRYGPGGGVSVLGGPGDNRNLDLDTPEGLAQAKKNNVAAYESQINAIRGLREARNPGITSSRDELTLGNTGGSEGLSEYERELNARNARVGEEDVRSLGHKKFNAVTRRRAAEVGADRNRVARRGQDIDRDVALLGLESDVYGDELAASAARYETGRKANQNAAELGIDQARLSLDTQKAQIDEAYKAGQLTIDDTKVKNAGFKNGNDAINQIFKTVREGGGPAAGFSQAFQTVGMKAAVQMFPGELENFVEGLQQLKESRE